MHTVALIHEDKYGSMQKRLFFLKKSEQIEWKFGTEVTDGNLPNTLHSMNHPLSSTITGLILGQNWALVLVGAVPTKSEMGKPWQWEERLKNGQSIKIWSGAALLYNTLHAFPVPV